MQIPTLPEKPTFTQVLVYIATIISVVIGTLAASGCAHFRASEIDIGPPVAPKVDIENLDESDALEPEED